MQTPRQPQLTPPQRPGSAGTASTHKDAAAASAGTAGFLRTPPLRPALLQPAARRPMPATAPQRPPRARPAPSAPRHQRVQHHQPRRRHRQQEPDDPGRQGLRGRHVGQDRLDGQPRQLDGQRYHGLQLRHRRADRQQRAHQRQRHGGRLDGEPDRLVSGSSQVGDLGANTFTDDQTILAAGGNDSAQHRGRSQHARHQATGADTNIGLTLSTKGHQRVSRRTNATVVQFEVAHTATAVNWRASPAHRRR